jgi:hypothetical protein
MTLDRRTFIVGTGIVAMAPAFELWPLPAPARATEVRPVEFMIEGWSLNDGSAAPNRVWIRLDGSWRAAWR